MNEYGIQLIVFENLVCAIASLKTCPDKPWKPHL